MNKIVRNALILTAITVVAGLLLGLVYEATKKPIAAVSEKNQQNAYKNVFEEADHFEAYTAFNETTAEEFTEASDYPDNTIVDAVVAKDKDDTDLGYVISVTSHTGYSGDLTLSVGITLEGTVNGYSLTSINETAGLGMKAEDKPFYSQFEGKDVDSFELTKDKVTKENQIQAISGATITSRAITNAVNLALSYFRSING
ncbi:electron transport complex subunit G [Clostridia bacterium]|nr:electron transport complex subunit G [Clostridia bacterium]